MDLTVVDVPDRQRYEARTPAGEVVGVAAYRRTSGRVAFTHTDVPPEHEGQGVASELIATALAAAREAGLTVVPQCSFVAAYVAKHPEHAQLVEGAGPPVPADSTAER